jgi:hypothetical protein
VLQGPATALRWELPEKLPMQLPTRAALGAVGGERELSSIHRRPIGARSLMVGRAPGNWRRSTAPPSSDVSGARQQLVRHRTRRLPFSVQTVPVIICECCPILLPMSDPVGAPDAPSSESATRMAARPLAMPGVVPAADVVQWRHDLSQTAAQWGAYRDMRADSTSVRSAGHLDRASADASSTGSAAPSADTSADSTQARGSAEGPTIVGVRSGTVLDQKLVAELRTVAARTDIAQRVLTILEPGQGPGSPAAAGRHGR